MNIETVKAVEERCYDIVNGLNLDFNKYLSEAEQRNCVEVNGIENSINNIIAIYFDAVQIAVEDKRKSLLLEPEAITVSQEINDCASQIMVSVFDECAQCIYGEDDIRRAFSDAVWQDNLRLPEVQAVIAECHAAMTEIGLGDKKSLKELEQYAQDYVLSIFDFDEYDSDMVKEGFLHETVEWIKESLELSDNSKLNISFKDNQHLYINEEQYVSGENMLSKGQKQIEQLKE